MGAVMRRYGLLYSVSAISAHITNRLNPYGGGWQMEWDEAFGEVNWGVGGLFRPLTLLFRPLFPIYICLFG